MPAYRRLSATKTGFSERAPSQSELYTFCNNRSSVRRSAALSAPAACASSWKAVASARAISAWPAGVSCRPSARPSLGCGWRSNRPRASSAVILPHPARLGQGIDEFLGIAARFIDLAVIFVGKRGAKGANGIADVLIFVGALLEHDRPFSSFARHRRVQRKGAATKEIYQIYDVSIRYKKMFLLVAVADDRAAARPGMTPDQFALILSRQMPDRDKRARATHIIETLSLASVQACVTALIAHIREAHHA